MATGVTFAFWRLSNESHTSFHAPRIAAFGIFRRAGLEEIGVLHAVQQQGRARERVLLDHVDRLEAELAQAPVRDG